MATLYRFSLTGTEPSLHVIAGKAKKLAGSIPVEHRKRIQVMREQGYSPRQIHIALRAKDLYTIEDIWDYIEGWRREQGFIAGIRLAGREPQPPSPGMIRRAA